jgi:recombinational DNA repair protein RecR
MRRSIFRFIGTKRELKERLAQLTGSNVIYLHNCELCGRLCAGDICRKCEPLFKRWTKKIATELAAKKPFDPSIA